MEVSAKFYVSGEELSEKIQKSRTSDNPTVRHLMVVDDEYGPRQSLRMLLKEQYKVHSKTFSS